MRSYGHVPRVLLLIATIVSISTFSTSSTMTSPGDPANNLNDVSDKWKTAQYGGQRAPRKVSVTRISDRPTDNWYYWMYYKYLMNNYNAAATNGKKDSARLEYDESSERMREIDEDGIVMPDIVMPDRIPLIGSRNIIYAPSFCPEGKKPDEVGRCRTVV
ncbi:uncharacterized protein LOC105191679 isoform X1 [Harpegnathos saltator]|uniref:Secapin-3 n=1 Tax=Harpegnathos saltator TaxID=610380 RepID=K7NBW8_HARSA|nr:uncharacterized protein LOC105191679 precursor [Harpegnathos saltator]XP_011153536.1 uncharacterized protein LOC105191679 isoform X1 [Harpegnathos saltator]AEM44797.1 secapin-3 [Harpegnathos saltator]